MNEEQREAMYYASKKNTLGSYKERIVKDYVLPTLQEFKQTMISKSPVFIFNTVYSKRNHFWEMTKMMNSDGVTGFCTAWADKTPRNLSWEEFYSHLKNGMEFIRF